MDRTEELGKAPIPGLLLRFSLPAIVGMMVNAIYNVVDRIFIGQNVGPLGLAGATVAFPIMLVLMGFGMLVGVGGSALVSIRLGERKEAEAEQILGNAVALLVILALSLTGLGLLFLAPLLRLFGASEAILPYAIDYTSIILLGSIFQALGFGMNNFIRGEGNPKVAMATMLIGAVLNIILDAVFIIGLGMGVSGAALATVIAQGSSAVWVMSYYFGGRSHLKIRRINLRPRKDIVLPMVAIGMAPFAMQMASSVLNGLLNNQLQRYGGDLAVSTMGIIFSIITFFLMPIFGLNQGAQPIIGYNYGARNYGRVRHAMLLAIVAASTLVSTGFVLIQLFPQVFVGFFAGSSAELLAMASMAIRIYFMMLPLIGFQIVAAGYFQASGKPKQAMVLSLSRQVLLLIPLIIVLPLKFGLTGL
ncbi:MAG: MATE family efflux transporter, partial [Spirochaetia bacterium]|nr:MATE family efflux transporter [Spirochaetia bacterium]